MFKQYIMTAIVIWSTDLASPWLVDRSYSLRHYEKKTSHCTDLRHY